MTQAISMVCHLISCEQKGRLSEGDEQWPCLKMGRLWMISIYIYNLSLYIYINHES